MTAPTALPVLETRAFRRHFTHELTASPLITTLQVNIGKVCNLACRHCHVESSPARTGGDENMSGQTVARILEWLEANPSIGTVDITGGSPEMNPYFKTMVERCRDLDRHVIDRCNPTIITHRDPRTGERFEWVPAFLAQHHVEVTASLPCYTADNVDQQRGRGAYDASVDGLLRLNAAGYGCEPERVLNLVYNPGGASLPPPQGTLEADYRRELADRFGIVFTRLYTIANMPIKRWRHDLERRGKLRDYMDLLVDAYNPATVEGLMCRHQINIDSQGRLFDCDFNQALDLGVPGYAKRYLWETTADELASRVIATGDHCYGCTAGAGSSCGGAIV